MLPALVSIRGSAPVRVDLLLLQAHLSLLAVITIAWPWLSTTHAIANPFSLEYPNTACSIAMTYW